MAACAPVDAIYSILPREFQTKGVFLLKPARLELIVLNARHHSVLTDLKGMKNQAVFAADDQVAPP